jgi:hypothetical protein
LIEKFADVERVDRLGETGVGVHRMAGDVEAKQFFFELEAFR